MCHSMHYLLHHCLSPDDLGEDPAKHLLFLQGPNLHQEAGSPPQSGDCASPVDSVPIGDPCFHHL